MKTLFKSMNRFKEVKLIHSKSNSPWWRKGLIWGLIVAFGIINSGCNKNEDLGEYYVKYVVNSSSPYIGKLNVIINTEKNENSTFIINKSSQWETTIGPVQKGFNAKLEVVDSTGTYILSLYTEIQVSKGGSPFAIKEMYGSDDPGESVQISYTIDY